MADEDGPAGTLADKLEHLFATVRQPDGRAWSNELVAATVRASGVPISAQYIWHLRRGARTNPTKRHLEALAGFFAVPPSYFFDETAADELAAELEVLAALRRPGLRDLAVRAADLSPDTLAGVLCLVEHARRLEDLPALPLR